MTTVAHGTHVKLRKGGRDWLSRVAGVLHAQLPESGRTRSQAIQLRIQLAQDPFLGCAIEWGLGLASTADLPGCLELQIVRGRPLCRCALRFCSQPPIAAIPDRLGGASLLTTEECRHRLA